MRPIFSDLTPFTRQYIATALWSSNDESDVSGGLPMDQHYGPDDVSDETLAAMVRDCEKFVRENAADVDLAADAYPQRNDDTGPYGTAGHDFWLTRCGHGAGYWDGDLPDDLGDRLTAASKRFGNVDLYIGDDGHIYH